MPRRFPLRGFLITVLGTLALDADALLKMSKVCCFFGVQAGESVCPSPECCSGQVVVKPYVCLFLKSTSDGPGKSTGSITSV